MYTYISYSDIIQKGDLSIYYELGDREDIRKRGIVEVDHSTGRLAFCCPLSRPGQTNMGAYYVSV